MKLKYKSVKRKVEDSVGYPVYCRVARSMDYKLVDRSKREIRSRIRDSVSVIKGLCFENNKVVIKK